MSSSSSALKDIDCSTTVAPPSSSSGVIPLPANQLYVHEVQRGNPLLAHIKNVKWSFSKDIVPDYAMSSSCALFLSLKYHFRHPKVRAMGFKFCDDCAMSYFNHCLFI